MLLLERWISNLIEIRDELIETLAGMKPEEFTWEPKPGMKSAQNLLLEIVAGEIYFTSFLSNPDQEFTWDDAYSQIKGEDLPTIIKELEIHRKNTIQLFMQYTEEELIKEIKSFNPCRLDQTYSPEEAMRYLIQHEYYHLGQLIYNRWMLGYDPNKENK